MVEWIAKLAAGCSEIKGNSVAPSLPPQAKNEEVNKNIPSVFKVTLRMDFGFTAEGIIPVEKVMGFGDDFFRQK